jgi:hypothetical protein
MQNGTIELGKVTEALEYFLKDTPKVFNKSDREAFIGFLNAFADDPTKTIYAEGTETVKAMQVADYLMGQVRGRPIVITADTKGEWIRSIKAMKTVA